MSRVGRFEWERAIRQLELRPPMVKLVALTLATYADASGVNIHPGEARLAADCGIKVRAARGHLATLRDLGLIERTFQGSSMGRARAADTYQLALPADVLTRVSARGSDPSTGTTVPVNIPGPEPHETEHRHHGACEQGRNTGTVVPDHRHGETEHRHGDDTTTGTTVPPTRTATKDVTTQDHGSTSRPVSQVGRMHESRRVRSEAVPA